MLHSGSTCFWGVADLSVSLTDICCICQPAHATGEDSIDSLTSRADAYAKRVRWVNANKDKIKETIRSKIAALVAV